MAKSKTEVEKTFFGSVGFLLAIGMEKRKGLAPFGRPAEALKKPDGKLSKRRFSLQPPGVATMTNFFAKVSQRVISGSSSRSSSQNQLDKGFGGSVNSLVDKEQGGQLWSSGSEEELNRQFADFDTYLGGFEERPTHLNLCAPDFPSQPQFLAPPTGGRQRSHSDTRTSTHRRLSQAFKLNFRKNSRSDSLSSPEPQLLSQHRPSLGDNSFLELLPEHVQVHHSTPMVCSPIRSPSISSSDAESDGCGPSIVISAPDAQVHSPTHQRQRAFSMFVADKGGSEQEKENSTTPRERSVSLTQDPALLEVDQHKRRRISFSNMLLPSRRGSR